MYGEKLRLQGSWEVAVARWLDEKKLDYIAHPKEKFAYFDINGQKRHYNPDFYVPEWDCYLDPKNSFCFGRDTFKLKAVRENNNGMNLLVMTKDVLDLFGIKVIGH